ncbi:unnamed protein product [Camellia sinensis]
MTWTNNRHGLANTTERLDRAMCNVAWRTLYPEATVKVLPRIYSNHSPLIVYTEGNLKLNTNGYSKGDPGQAGYGGLLRNVTGTWLWGYYGKLGHYTNVEAELWAIYKGLTILFQKGTIDVEIETDATQVIKLTQDGPNHNSPYKAIIEDTKFLMKRRNCTLGHTLREGNKVANRLANIGVEQDNHVVILEDPLENVIAVVIDDMNGAHFERD